MWHRQVRQQETVSRAGILQICFMLERSRMDGYWYWWYHGHTKVIAATAPSQNLLVPSQSLWSRPREGENSKPFWWKPPFVVYDWWGYVGFATMGKTLRCFHSSSVQHCTSSHCLVPLAAQPWVSPAVSKENCSFTMIKGRFNMVKISILFHVYARNSIKIIQLQYFAIWCNLHDICQFSPFSWSICWYVLWDIVTPCHSIVIHIDAVVCSPFSTSPGRSPLYSGKFQWRIPAWANSIIAWLWLVVEVMSSMRVMWLEWLTRIKFKATKLVKPTSTIVVDAALNQPVNSGSYNILLKEV